MRRPSAILLAVLVMSLATRARAGNEDGFFVDNPAPGGGLSSATHFYGLSSGLQMTTRHALSDAAADSLVLTTVLALRYA